MSNLLIIGLDGASWTLLDQLIEDGYMPTLEKLRQSQKSGVLHSTLPPITPAAWSSFHTGKKPGSHGIVDFVYYNKDSKSADIVDSTWLPKTVWDELLPEYSSIIINVPMTYPTDVFETDIVSGILTPDAQSDWTSRPQLKQEILAEIPNYQPITMEYGSAAEVADDPKGYVLSLKEKIELRKEIGSYMIAKNEYDIIMTQFQVLDWVQHVLWPFLDMSHPLFNQETYDYIGTNIYGEVDTAISELWTQSQSHNKNVELLIVSDHGFQRHHKRVMVGNILYRNGLFDMHGGKKQKINSLLQPVGVQMEIHNTIELLGRTMWGFVYLNQIDSKDTIYKKIQEICSQITDPETNKKVIKKVWKREELYSGNKVDILPDILIEPVHGYSVTAAIEKETADFVDVEFGKDFHNGYHHPDGVVLGTASEKLPDHIADCASYIKKVVTSN